MDGTLQRIAQAGRQLLDQEGPEAVSMRRIAKAVRITPMAIYRHYPDRDALLNAIADQGFTELATRLAARATSRNFDERLMTMGEIYLDHALQNPRLFELMFLKQRKGARRFPGDFKSGGSPTANLMADVLREGMSSGWLRKDDVWEITFEIGALSHGLIMLYLGGRMGLTPARFRALYRRAFRRYVRGIRK
jgi:AcrR family transcriptional regulator